MSEKSSSDKASSGEEYVPDSDSSSHVLDRENPERSKIYCKSLELPEFEVSSSNLVPGNMVTANELGAGNSNSGSEDENEPQDKRLLQSSSLRNKTYCYICGKAQTKFTRHLKNHEKTHVDVARVLMIPKKSKEHMK